MARWRPIRKLRRWVIAECTRLLTKPLASYVQRVPNNVDKLKKTLRKGDVLLVEGDQRISQVIRYLTQSCWSHCALYVGDELLHGDAQRAAALRQCFGDEAEHLLIEAEVGQGVCASPLSKYERYNIRICRPQGLQRGDVATLLGYVIDHLGRRYNIRHIVELLRFFFPVSIVPRRWRRAALTFGSDRRRAVICSSLIAAAFARVGYPILPQVTLTDATVPPATWWKRILTRSEGRPLATFHRLNTALVTPRDFDLSPYFEVVKFNHLGDPRLDYREIVWDNDNVPEPAPLELSAAALTGTAVAAQALRLRHRLRPAVVGGLSALAAVLQRFRG
jgi:Permuted papain-like amidase enzyme, YaeF/YiiX, C92 family